MIKEIIEQIHRIDLDIEMLADIASYLDDEEFEYLNGSELKSLRYQRKELVESLKEMQQEELYLGLKI